MCLAEKAAMLIFLNDGEKVFYRVDFGVRHVPLSDDILHLRIVLLSSKPIPFDRFLIILWNALSALIQMSKVALSTNKSLVCGYWTRADMTLAALIPPPHSSGAPHAALNSAIARSRLGALGLTVRLNSSV